MTPISTSPTLLIGKPEVLMREERGIIVESGVSVDVFPSGKQVLILRSEQGSEAPRINVVTNWFEEIKKTIQSGK